MKIEWHIEDKYPQRNAKYEIEIDDQEFVGLPHDEAMELVYEYIQPDFEEKVSYRAAPETHQQVEDLLKSLAEFDPPVPAGHPPTPDCQGCLGMETVIICNMCGIGVNS